MRNEKEEENEYMSDVLISCMSTSILFWCGETEYFNPSWGRKVPALSTS